MKKTIMTLILSGLLLSGCTSGNSVSVQPEETVSAASAAETAAESSETAAQTVETTAETSAAETTAVQNATYDYVHGEDGYYNLKEEMPEFKMNVQKYGTCWLHAAAASMESSYCKEHGSYIDLDVLELLDIIYLNEKQEGYILKNGANGRDLGGMQWMVTDTLSRGFGDLTLDSSIDMDVNDRDTIKEVIRTRGAVAVEVPDTDRSKKAVHGAYYTMNDTGSDSFDHDITLIGWDDHFPKEYFNEPAAEDGAWITYNSNYGPDKFYYVSYCTPIGYAYSHTFTDKYGEVLSYDAGNAPGRHIRTGNSTTTANVFHKDGRLAAVGTFNKGIPQDIKIEVYDSSFDNLLYSQDAVLDYKGYHTIELDEPVDVTDFAVVITYTNPKGAPVEGETLDFDSMLGYKTVSAPGQSYIYTEDGWKDLTDEDIRDVLGIDFDPNNCCIKALMEK